MWLALSFLLTIWNGIAWSEYQSGNVITLSNRPVYTVFWTEPVTDPLNELTCTFTMQGDETYITRGQGVWNNCPRPANVRFYFTSSTNTYDVPYAGTHPNDFWWSAQSVTLRNGTHTLSATTQPQHWSNALGCWATNCIEGFTQCLDAVQRVGISLSGGCFYDTGIAVTNGVVIIQIKDFRVNPALVSEERQSDE